MSDALMQLPSGLRAQLATALETGLVDTAGGSVDAIGIRETERPIVAAALQYFTGLGLSPEAAAAWLRSLDRLSARSPRPDLVWSGPQAAGMRARDTRQVYSQLLGSVERSLWASSYAFFDGRRTFEILARRMDAVPALQVTLLLNIQRRRGDDVLGEVVVRRFAEQFWGQDWPGTRRPDIYYDPRAVEEERNAVLHAKAVVADDESVFVTSANLTEAAFDRNIELGLLVRDRALAASIVAHFQGLIDRGRLVPLPAE